MDALHEFLNSQAGLAEQGLGVLAFADFLTGTFAAMKDGTFSADALAAFVRKHLLGRVFPIGTLLVVGYFGGAAGQLILGGAIAAGAAYVAETAASILGNLAPPKESELKDTNPVNPVPTE